MSEFDNTLAKRVCNKCFGGDAVAMKRHADTYLVSGHTAVRPLGAAFRALLPGRARRVFWENAARQLAAHLATVPLVTPGSLPTWTTSAGGEKRWQKWATGQAARCCRRAKVWVQKTGASAAVPSRSQWREAILDAIRNSDGRGRFSRLPLTLAGIQPTDPRWPSVDHLTNPANVSVVLEQRIFNDVKSILSPNELRLVAGHMAVVLAAELTRLEDNWRPDRSFGTSEKADEPPVPDKR